MCNFCTRSHRRKRNITRYIPLYNPDRILSVGSRVNSKRGTPFRIRARQLLKGN